MNYEKELLENPPYFNIWESIESYGFDLNSFMENGFNQFISHTYLTDFIEFRKAYIIRDFLKLRFYAHKFKGSFALLCSTYIEPFCFRMQKKIETGSIDVEDIYVEIVKRMNIFLIKLIDFAKKLKNPIDKSILKMFRNVHDECDLFEDISVRQKLSGEHQTSADLISDKHITNDKLLSCDRFVGDDNLAYNKNIDDMFQGQEPATKQCCSFNKSNCMIL